MVSGRLFSLTPREFIGSFVGPGCPSSAELMGEQLVKLLSSGRLGDGFLPVIDLTPLDGHMLFDAVSGEYASAGSLDGWNWMQFKALLVNCFDGLPSVLRLVRGQGEVAAGPAGCFCGYDPKAEGNVTPLGHLLSVLPIVYPLWATVRLEHLQTWCDSWLPSSVFSVGSARSSVDAWYSTSLGIVEAVSGIVDDDIHLFVADVVRSFDTVDRNILDCVLSSFGLPGWFRHVYSECHARVRKRFKLSAGFGEPWTRDAGILQGCPLSMMFIVALYLPC